MGTETHDDAGVYRLTPDLAIVQTIDFFPPVVDDPYIYGQIAAANALSDVYAMGGEPKTVLNLMAYPDAEVGPEKIGQILQGGADRCLRAGAVILGGHTVRDQEIKFGLAVTGLIHPEKIWTNASAKIGDLLILTKPLGTGFVTTSAKKMACPDDILHSACTSMIQLNQIGRDAILAVGGVESVSAVTDITGFGLAGHSYEMAEGSNVSLRIYPDRLPVIDGIEKNGLTRYRTRASKSNFEYVQERTILSSAIDPIRKEFLWDAQTSGGLLISVRPNASSQLIQELLNRGAICAEIIGEVLEPQGPLLIFENAAK